MNLCIIDAWLPEESALVNSHWVAEQTVLALQRHHPDLKLGILASEDITPASVHAALGQEYEGFAYFGHGNENALRHNRQTIIGREQVLLLRARWFHAFACLSGEFLGQDALDSGAAAYLGYAVAVIVEWDPSQLPDELRALLTELVTAATLQLAGGVRSRGTICRSVRSASDHLVEWLSEHEDVAATLPPSHIMGLNALARLLHQRLVLKGVAVTA